MIPRSTKQSTYWPSEMDEFISIYQKETDVEKRNQFFTDKMYMPIYRLAEAVANKHRISETTLESHDSTINNLIEFAVSKLHKYDISKGFKSFSFLNLCLRNELWQTNKRSFERSNKVISVHDLVVCDDAVPDDVAALQEPLIQQTEDPVEFYDCLKNYWNKHITTYFPQKKIQRYNAAKTILSLLDDVDGDIRFSLPKERNACLRNLYEKSGYGKAKTRYITSALEIISAVNQALYKIFLNNPDALYDMDPIEVTISTPRKKNAKTELTAKQRWCRNYYLRNKDKICNYYKQRRKENTI